MKFSVFTLGCKVNQAESSEIENTIKTRGHDIVGLSGNPDVCIINTCTVTAKSDYQSRQLIRRANRAGAKVVVTGCYSEINRDAVISMQGVADVAANADKVNIISRIISDTSCDTLHLNPVGRSRQFMKVQDGCSFSCTYCIIPKARGASRSIAIEEIVEKIRDSSDIYNEVVLTGIHLGTYGYDLLPKVSLYDLTDSILRNTLIKRIRLSSLEIREIGDRLLLLIQGDRVCRHLHIPLQSGDDSVLKAMNRNYTVKEFLQGFERIYSKVPDIAIGTDVIVGFPNEGKTEFENTMRILEMLPIAYIHVFPYSARPGTMASNIAESVSPQEKKDRVTALRELSHAKKQRYMQEQIGKVLEVVVEEVVGKDRVLGITGNYLRVNLPLDGDRLRNIVPVRVVGIVDDMLSGHPVKSI